MKKYSVLLCSLLLVACQSAPPKVISPYPVLSITGWYDVNSYEQTECSSEGLVYLKFGGNTMAIPKERLSRASANHHGKGAVVNSRKILNSENLYTLGCKTNPLDTRLAFLYQDPTKGNQWKQPVVKIIVSDPVVYDVSRIGKIMRDDSKCTVNGGFRRCVNNEKPYSHKHGYLDITYIQNKRIFGDSVFKCSFNKGATNCSINRHLRDDVYVGLVYYDDSVKGHTWAHGEIGKAVSLAKGMLVR